MSLQSIGNYDIVHKIAEGGMGTVYKGRHRQSGLVVAIKIIPPATSRNPVLLRRFEQEFRAASLLDHPNIVKAIEYNGLGASPFLVMEYVDGESLGQKIERDGAMDEFEAIRVLAQVCQGLHRAHKQGMIHRDVKPDNILVTADGVAKLTDLGLVKDVEGEMNLTRTGRGLGTPHFMAPEQFRNAKNANTHCDIYSLGATLYAMVTGEIPFGKCGPLDCWMKKVHNDFPWPRQVNPNISERVDWAIRRAMSGDPEQRPASCREFVEDLTGQTIRPQAQQGGGEGDLWYLVYRDESDQMHTVKGSTDGIRRALTEGLLGDADNIRACRSKQGPFLPLRGIPEFRDIVIAPAPLPPSAPPTTPAPASASSGSWQRAAAAAPPSPDDAVDFNAPLDRSPSASRSSPSGRIGATSSRMAQPTGRMSPAPATASIPASGAHTPPQHSGRFAPPAYPTPPVHEASGRLPHIAIPGGPAAPPPRRTDWLLVVMVALFSLVLGAGAMILAQQQGLVPPVQVK